MFKQLSSAEVTLIKVQEFSKKEIPSRNGLVNKPHSHKKIKDKDATN